MRVLLIDDDVCILVGLAAALKQNGMAVQIAHDGEAGLAKAKRLHPDLILLDIMMPGLNGLQVKQLLAKDHETAEIPVLFISGRTNEADITTALQLGAVGYLTKPIRLKDLIARIHAIGETSGGE